jgi:hypothetical protein
MGFMKGKGARLALFIGGVKVDAIDVESWDLSEEAEEIKDDVNGEDRSRPDKVINLYKLSLKCFNATSDKLKALLQYDKNLDDNAQPVVAFGLKLTDEQNGSDQFGLKECVIDAWKWASGGRTARQMLDIPIRGRYFELL